MDLEMLIKLITEQVLLKIDNENNYNSKKILVIFTGSTIGLEESVSELKKLKKHGFKMKAVLSEFSKNIVDMNVLNELFHKEDIYVDDKCNSNEEIYNEDFDLLIGANLTVNTLSKVAVGICDTLPTRLIQKCIMDGSEIIAIKDACDLDNLNGRKVGYKNIPPAFINMIKEYLDRLESFGIKLLNSNNVFEYAKNPVDKVENCNNAEVEINKKIISREDIAQNSKSKKISVPSNAIITSLAMDLCDEKGIKIIKR